MSANEKNSQEKQPGQKLRQVVLSEPYRALAEDGFYSFETPIGIMCVLSTPDLVHAVELITLDTQGFRSAPARMPIQAELEAQYKAYFAKKLERFDLPLAMEKLSPFTQKVMNLLRDLPFGETCTYKELATQAGKPNAARAVGTVMARNRWLIAIPCHRVLPVSGKIGMYSAPGGADTKAWLLRHEGHRVEDYKIVKGNKT